jgi:hypothetical protein
VNRADPAHGHPQPLDLDSQPDHLRHPALKPQQGMSRQALVVPVQVNG